MGEVETLPYELWKEILLNLDFVNFPFNREIYKIYSDENFWREKFRLKNYPLYFIPKTISGWIKEFNLNK